MPRTISPTNTRPKNSLNVAVTLRGTVTSTSAQTSRMIPEPRRSVQSKQLTQRSFCDGPNHIINHHRDGSRRLSAWNFRSSRITAMKRNFERILALSLRQAQYVTHVPSERNRWQTTPAANTGETRGAKSGATPKIYTTTSSTSPSPDISRGAVGSRYNSSATVSDIKQGLSPACLKLRESYIKSSQKPDKRLKHQRQPKVEVRRVHVLRSVFRQSCHLLNRYFQAWTTEQLETPPAVDFSPEELSADRAMSRSPWPLREAMHQLCPTERAIYEKVRRFLRNGNAS